METYLIIDGNSIINRAFYAIKLLTNQHGVYTNGIYGFLSILFKQLDEHNPDYIAVAFDMRAPTFRHKQYKEYKAQRKGMPDELAMQMPILKEVLSAMNITIYEKEGYEADDIIGTVSRLCDQQQVECLILTGDKDDLQLCSDTTKVLLTVTRAGQTATTVYDAAAMRAQYGVTPAEFIDVKALMGDASDNIPGVKGIGEKSAFSLIGQFHSLDNLYAHLDDPAIKPAARKKLEEGRDMAYMSQSLATIDRQVPGEFALSGAKRQAYDTPRLAKLFQNLDFHAFSKRIGGSGDDMPEGNRLPSLPFVRLDTRQALQDAIAAAGKRLVYRLYTVGGELYAMAVLSDGKAAFISRDITVTDSDMADAFRAAAEDGTVCKVSLDCKEDMVLLHRYGIGYADHYFDVSVAGYILSPARARYDIAGMASEFLGCTAVDAKELFGKGRGRRELDGLSAGELEPLVCSELAALSALQEYEEAAIGELGQQKLCYEIEFPLTKVLASMEILGFAVDREQLLAFGGLLSARMKEQETAIYALAGGEFNINSPRQLGEILFEKLGLPAKKKTKTGYSTDAETLEKLKDKHEIVGHILSYRQVAKLKSTYVDGLLGLIDPKDGRIHSKFMQTVAVTGRISSTEPNLQNIPMRTDLGRELRRMFVPQSGDVLVDADYSQIELRVLAHIADDANMIAAFAGGEDIHTATAMHVFGVSKDEITPLLRSRAKAVNFGIVYGMGSFSLSQDLHISNAEAKDYIDQYFAKHPNVKAYMDGAVEQAKNAGYVETLFGRRRYLPEVKSSNFMLRAAGERMAMNTPIQGTAADIIKIAMVRVYRELKKRGMQSRLILQVHDELILECPPNEAEQAKALLKECMEGAADLKVPLTADAQAGESWYDAK